MTILVKLSPWTKYILLMLVLVALYAAGIHYIDSCEDEVGFLVQQAGRVSVC